jgi:hypothetical protein
MPSFIHTPGEENHWQKVKKMVKEEYPEATGDDFWALVNSIYHKKYKKSTNKASNSRLISVARKEVQKTPKKRLIAQRKDLT